jgi:hypothetical protein
MSLINHQENFLLPFDPLPEQIIKPSLLKAIFTGDDYVIVGTDVDRYIVISLLSAK